MLIDQEALLIFILCGFLEGGNGADLSANCTFDQRTFCGWENEILGDHFEWTLISGPTPSWLTGPNKDHTGNGSYIYIETSLPRGFGEFARLISPLLQGPKQMRFFFHMFGYHVENLTIYVKENNTETRLWGRMRNHGDRWIEGCVQIKRKGGYQVIIEASTGPSWDADIAIDDISFIDSSRTCPVLIIPDDELLAANCTFDKHFCGWWHYRYQINWRRHSNSTPSIGTGPSSDHTGNGYYIYTEASTPARAGDIAVLMSPRMTGPRCMTFYYHMYGIHMGTVEVHVYPNPPLKSYTIWKIQGNQGNKWNEAKVSITQHGTYKVSFKATVGTSYMSDVAIDDVSFTKVACSPSSSGQSSGNCDFDNSGLCFWQNHYLDDDFDWTLRQGPTPSQGTGPSADHTTGKGRYIYIEASSPRVFGHQARLLSPMMEGPQCMMFYYHMYGLTMSCITVYVKNASNGAADKVLWLKSGDRGNRWHRGLVDVREQGKYQIIIEGTRGTSWQGDAAIDDLSFRSGSCGERDKSTFYVSSGRGRQYQITHQPFGPSGYSEYFKFDLEQSLGFPDEEGYFIYPKVTKLGQNFITRKLDFKAYAILPLDYIIEGRHNSSAAVYFVNRGQPLTQMISLDNYTQVGCCSDEDVSQFRVYNVTEQGSNRSSACLPGWHQIGNYCHLLFLENVVTWNDARVDCHKKGGDLAILPHHHELKELSRIATSLGHPQASLYLGLYGQFNWIWQDTGKTPSSNLWGPKEPSGDGRCGALLNAIKWNSQWVGLGWRWNDLPCHQQHGYICEDYNAPLNPVAFFPLNGRYKSADIGRQQQRRGQEVGVYLTPGPFGNPNGSFYFNGTENSYVEFPSSETLDTRYSISILAWINPEKDGPIFNYRRNAWGVHLWVNAPFMLFARFVFRDNSWPGPLMSRELRKNEWQYVGTTYNGDTGEATLWIGNRTVTTKNIGKRELATNANVRMGARIGDKRYFRGKVACLQVYAEALSNEQIMVAKDRCNNINETIQCRTGFRPIHGGCFLFNATALTTWHQASTACREKGARLAIVDRPGLRSAMTQVLYKLRPTPDTIYIGLVVHEAWSWVDGSFVNSSVWMPSYPRSTSATSCAILSRAASKLANVNCASLSNYVCQSNKINVAHRRPVTSSSARHSYDPSLAVDGSYTSCFRSKKESDPWLEIQLDAPVLVYQVAVRFPQDCCTQKEGTFIIEVVDKHPGNLYSCKNWAKYNSGLSEDLQCRPPILAQYVRLSVFKATTPLAVCHVAVYAFDSSVNAKGVLREGWYNVKYNEKLAPNMKTNPAFKNTPQGQNVIQHFDSPKDFANFYIQRLAAHIQVEETGNYTFYLACDDKCELWKFDVHEDGMDDKIDNDNNVEEESNRLINLNSFTGHQEWNRYPDLQTSKHVRMSRCYMYKLQVFMRESGVEDHVSLAMRAPNGDFEGPIENRRLYWLLPGKRSLSFVLKNDEKWISTLVGSDLQISGNYSYCCHGVYCPDCSLQLYFSLMNKRLLLDANARMDCLNSSFSIRFNIETQPGNYSIKIHHSFVNDSEQAERQREIGNLEVKAVILKECRFPSGLCDWITYGESNDQIWKSSHAQATTLPGYFAYLDGNYRAFLMSQPLPWQKVYQNIGLCLRFSYLMPNTTASHLKVLLSSQLNETVIWHLIGYHGNEWSRAQVSWAAQKGTKVIFEGVGILKNGINVAIDDIEITTEACSLMPHYATPDFRCTAEQFQCDNKECVKKNLLCDGDFACQDKSDEKNCACPSNKFSCLSGECVPATSLCDGIKDCTDRSDEENCRVECKEEFQCADGNCVPWSKTCSMDTGACVDNTQNPSICEMGSCSLDDLGCPAANSSSSSADQDHCRSFRGLCGFENGLCGMSHDRNSTFFWSLGSAATPTDDTGPSYDHTTFTRKGTYIFIEASQRNHGDKARLLSGEMDRNETVCLQFWYHMYGKDIGNLSVYIRTNQSETLVWRQTAKHGNRWRFAQTALRHEQRYKFVFEGVTLRGNEGDIAVDDLAILEGSCDKVTNQESPDCYFEEDLCGWETHDGWSLAFYLSDLQTNGGFVHLTKDDNEKYRNITTPHFNTDSYKWKCVRFSYYIGRNLGGQRPRLIVSLVYRKSRPVIIFHATKATGRWQYVQRPIYSWQTDAQIVYSGYNSHFFGANVGIDDVSFSTETCKDIPSGSVLPGQSCGNFDFEKQTLEGWKRQGTAFNNQPTFGDNVKARTFGSQSANQQGMWWIGSYENRPSSLLKPGGVQGETPVGFLMSPLIRLTGSVLSFLIGGGCDISKVGLDIVVDQLPRWIFTGNCSDEMRRIVINVGRYKGRIAQLRLQDLSRSVWGHINFDDLRGDYECLESQACDISKKSFCGWYNQNNMSQWQSADYDEVENMNAEIQQYIKQVNESTLSPKAQRLLFDFELHMGNMSTGHVTLQEISPLKYGFTLCFWLRTKTEGFFVAYNIAVEEKEKLAFGLFHSQVLVVQIDGIVKITSVTLLDGLWHHVCETWDSYGGLVEIYKDGQRVEQFTGFRNLKISGGGSLSIGYMAATGNDSTVHGVLAGLNLWDYYFSKEEVLRMSFGCGEESGNVKSWAAVPKGISGKINRKPASCKDRNATRLIVKANSTAINITAVLMSPQYARSKDWYTQCLRFRYTMFGPGARKLRIYQKVDTFPERPVWEDSDNTHSTWTYGQVPLAAVSKYKVLIKGEVSSEPGYIAIAGVHIADFGPCKHEPPRAINACSESLINTSGFIFSPSYPSYYPDDTTCTWRISVPRGYVIRLEFKEFVLEDHPMCDHDFVKVIDGLSGSARMLGKFCGFTYPPVFQSSSNHLMVIFKSNNEHYRTGFKAYYQPVKDYEEDSLSCSRHQGCPTNCKCTFLSNSPTQLHSALLVEGQELLMVPSNFPSDTAALMFQKNRISHLREGSFHNLLKLQYIDISNNIVLYVDVDAFQNLSSLTTMRLNSNFIRNLPADVFQRIDSLRVLDLSRNLLGRAAEGIFDGLSRLHVLSLHSNRIGELENGVFNSTGNLTFLYLQDNEINNLPDGIFSFLSKLEILDLSTNKLTKLTKGSLRGLHSLRRLYLHNNKLSDVSPDAFSELSNLKYLKLDRFILCCYARKSIAGLECDSPVDEFSSCDDLMKNKALQVCIWILGISAFLGNFFVIIWRLIDKEERRVHSFLLTNLAIADLLMGVYLLLIAIMDARWQGEYFKHDIAWRSGVGCKLAGILSMLSSEVSVLILTIITADRLVCIVFPFRFNRLRYKKAFLVCSCSWLFGLLISVLPVAEISYFYDKDKDFGFYSRSAVCLPLQLSADRPVGWEYAIAFFIGLNAISFVFIFIAYVAMFWTVHNASKAVRSTSMSKESAMARRLLFIVMTDFFCWMPIIIISILSLLGKFYDPKKQAYVWIAVFVLPLNSSINPILYTFSTTRVKNQLERKKKTAGSFILRNIRRMTTAAGDNQTMDRLKSVVDDATMVSSINPSPQLMTREGNEQTVIREPERIKIRLIEVPAIFQDEASSSVGYVIAWLERSKSLSMNLLKFFEKDAEGTWKRETDLMLQLRDLREHPNLMNYCWHSEASYHDIDSGKIKLSALKDTSFLICYEFVSSTTLEDFLSEGATTMNSDAVCAVAIDVISAIAHLQAHGICHNNISTRSILIGYCARVPPIRAVLGGFTRAHRVADGEGTYSNWACAEQSFGGSDLEQFGQLLATLLGHCNGSSEYTELHEIMNLCFENTQGKRASPDRVKFLLEKVSKSEGVWDTWL